MKKGEEGKEWKRKKKSSPSTMIPNRRRALLAFFFFFLFLQRCDDSWMRGDRDIMVR